MIKINYFSIFNINLYLSTMQKNKSSIINIRRLNNLLIRKLKYKSKNL